MSLLMMLMFLLFMSFFLFSKFKMMIISNLLFIMSFMLMIKYNYTNNWSMIYYFMGLDNYSFILLLLSFWILALMFMIHKVDNINLYSNLLLLLLLCLFISFSSMNFFIFYVFFEISMLPTILLIMGWGYQPERVSASMYLFFYCLFASLPLMIIIYYLYYLHYSMNYEILMWSLLENSIMYYFLIFAFLMKLPMFMFHVWLPKAHVEAPVAGSMILAGVLLKLGGYGLCRSMMMMMKSGIKVNYLFMSISLIGMIYLSTVCLRSLDMKMLVAYSSVVHMGLMLVSLMTLSYWGYISGLLMMIGHGLCSSALFVMVNYFYERSGSRNIMLNKGMVYFIPSMCLWWFIFCSINMSAPISLNMLSEIMMVGAIMSWSFNVILILGIGMFLSATYSLYLFSYSFHGKWSSLLMKINPNSSNEFLIIILHWVPLNFIILKMDMIM
uniref:NADH-ubiquinone oxidoreductase chain 4 n=1 Tax=Wiebesia pumilae TaxID=150944 RepID=A0A8A3UVL9_9HYME|nr:NADH dehydrogenase subunit 4 [Wiebesia pumilae]